MVFLRDGLVTWGIRRGGTVATAWDMDSGEALALYNMCWSKIELGALRPTLPWHARPSTASEVYEIRHRPQTRRSCTYTNIYDVARLACRCILFLCFGGMLQLGSLQPELGRNGPTSANDDGSAASTPPRGRPVHRRVLDGRT